MIGSWFVAYTGLELQILLFLLGLSSQVGTTWPGSGVSFNGCTMLVAQYLATPVFDTDPQSLTYSSKVHKT